jgi:hypothetical protein
MPRLHCATALSCSAASRAATIFSASSTAAFSSATCWIAASRSCSADSVARRSALSFAASSCFRAASKRAFSRSADAFAWAAAAFFPAAALRSSAFTSSRASSASASASCWALAAARPAALLQHARGRTFQAYGWCRILDRRVSAECDSGTCCCRHWRSSRCALTWRQQLAPGPESGRRHRSHTPTALR